MSRTNRNLPENGRFYRKPKTFNEIKQNCQLEADIKNEEIPSICKRNRMRRFIPTFWDDIFISIFK